MTTGEKIAALRLDRDVRQTELADAIHLHPSVLSRIEKGARPARVDELKAIADFFNVSMDSLLGKPFRPQIDMSSDEDALLDGYRHLNSEGQRTLMMLLGSLRLSHGRQLAHA